MDILISSNLERLLYHAADGDDAIVTELMRALNTDGVYRVSDALLANIKAHFAAGYCNEDRVKAVIREHYEKYHYLCDTHTAVAIGVYEDYVKTTGDDIPAFIDSTASPYKFSGSVLQAVSDKNYAGLSEFDMVDKLFEITGCEVPKPLQSLKDKKVRFTEVCDRENMAEIVFKMLHI